MMSSSSETQSGGLLASLKNALFESDRKAPQGEKTAPAAPMMVRSQASGTAAPVGVDVQSQEAMVKYLTDISVSSSGQPTAYTKLLQAATRLEKFIPDEAARFKGAISVDEGLTSADVLNSIEKIHLAALKDEVVRLENYIAKQEVDEVQARMTAIEGLQGRVAAGIEERKRLQAELDAHLAKIAAVNEEHNREIAATLQQADAKKVEIDLARKNVSAASSQVSGRFLEMREKLAKYLA